MDPFVVSTAYRTVILHYPGTRVVEVFHPVSESENVAVTVERIAIQPNLLQAGQLCYAHRKSR